MQRKFNSAVLVFLTTISLLYARENNYYIYSGDKLIEEYDHAGNCVKEYIYLGNKLIAEYVPQTGKYYYYMSDQINSSRVIIDDDLNLVYSSAHGPYGEPLKTWTNTFDPNPKFSGKEREKGYTNHDYFGARYYDNSSYRFISVDPIINKSEALVNPNSLAAFEILPPCLSITFRIKIRSVSCRFKFSAFSKASF